MLQGVVSLFTMEAKYIIVTEAVKEVLLRGLVVELGSVYKQVEVHYDS